MAVALPGVVQLVAIRELGDERAGILGERVEEDAVDGDREELDFALAQRAQSHNEPHALPDLHRRLPPRTGAPAKRRRVVR